MYNKLLDSLFERWEESLLDDQKKLFCKDGLVLKYGKPDTFVDDEWEKSKRRIVFLLKDKNTPDGDDIRRWLIDEKNGAFCRNLSGGNVGKTGFLPNIARILYGLTEGDCQGFSEIKNKKSEIKSVWNTYPFALIEAKKIAGYSSVSSEQVRNALTIDEKFLKEELDILNPNIIICCDAEDSQFEFITQKYLSGEQPIIYDYRYPFWDEKEQVNFYNPSITWHCCLWYYPNKNIVVIKSFHPSRLGKTGDWVVYERVVSAFRTFIKDYPEF